MFFTRAESRPALWSRLFHGVGATVTLCIMAATMLLVIQPMENRVTELQDKVTELSAALAVEDAVQAEHQLLTARRTDADQKVETLLTRIPNVPRESDFLGQVTTLASEVGLTIIDYRPGSAAEKKGYKQMTLTLSSDGSYQAVCTFLNRIHQLPRLSRVLTLDISPAGDDGIYRMMMTLTIFFAPESKLTTARLETDNV